ncbi:outer membrane protein [Labrys okinawensis]|uniref:outer membrane protein n=1 Tax=Labrys okinawensis TaxID=346911 RepID=UPI0039BC9C54
MPIFRSLPAAFAVIAIPAATMAADLAPNRIEPIAPVMPYSWAGFYVGANAGYAFGGSDEVGLWHNSTKDGIIGKIGGKGFVGGVQAGYNYQIDNFVLGLEADIQGGAVTDSVSNAALDGGSRAHSKINWYGTLRPRVGYAIDRTLIYATGGLAVAGVDYQLSATNYGAFSKTSTKAGWTVGAGIEQAITDNISVKLEYDYVGFERYRTGNTNLYSYPTPSFHAIRVGVNYKF